MTGLVIGDAVIWLVLGVLLGWTLTRWSTLRTALALAVAVTVLGMVLALWRVAGAGAEGLGGAAAALLFSTPATLGLALGALAAHLLRPRA
jgi:hypothetical protein